MQAQLRLHHDMMMSCVIYIGHTLRTYHGNILHNCDHVFKARCLLTWHLNITFLNTRDLYV